MVHIPTGLVTRFTEERSQFQNRRKAVKRIQEKLISLQQEQKEKQAKAAWAEHYRIVRGNPVRIYEGEKFLPKRI